MKNFCITQGAQSIIEIYTLPYVKQIASEKFLHNTGCSLQSRGVGGDICLLWLIHADLWQKPIQYCKAIILQLKKIFKAICEASDPRKHVKG